MVNGDTLRTHQAYYAGDSQGWQQQARLLQSLWRERRDLPPRGEGEQDGSYLPDSEAIDRSGAAYISDDARAALNWALKHKQDGAVLQEKRLWYNLLSSQPLCFNLFGPLSEHVADPRTSATLNAVWPDIDRITSITYEHSPGRGDDAFLGNRTAFDVYIEYIGRSGAERFLGIEIKYHEDLSGGAPALRARALAVLCDSGAFTSMAEKAVTTGRTAQLVLYHLLALSMNAHGGRQGKFVVVYPAANRAVGEQVSIYRSHLLDEDETFQELTLEQLVAGLRTILDAEWLDEFEDRYLDISPIDRLDAHHG